MFMEKIDLPRVTMRDRFRALYSAARRDRLAPEQVCEMALAMTGEPCEMWRYPKACRLTDAVMCARAPIPVLRTNLRRTVLNRWGSRYGLRSPSMTSPRFEIWRRHTATADRLRKSLGDAGRLGLDAGGWATGEVWPTAA